MASIWNSSVTHTREEELTERTRELTNVVRLGLVMGFTLLGGVALFASYAYCRYARKPRALREAHFCDRFTELCCPTSTDKYHKRYDAFVSFSHQDDRFVIEELVPKLERAPLSLKLCLHFRDWDVGGFIPEQIVKSIEQSHRTVIVLSRGFLQSVWGRLEFRVAHTSAVREGRARIVVVLLEDLLDTNPFDEDLRTYIETGTYVKWGDPQFWQTLGQYLRPKRTWKKLRLFTNRIAERERIEERSTEFTNNMCGVEIEEVL